MKKTLIYSGREIIAASNQGTFVNIEKNGVTIKLTAPELIGILIGLNELRLENGLDELNILISEREKIKKLESEE